MKKNEAHLPLSLFTMLALASFVSACGSKNSEDEGVIQNILEREWIQIACTSNRDIPAFGASRKVSLVLLADKTQSRVETYYTSNNCTDPAVSVTYNGDYVKNAESDQDGNIDLNYHRVVVKPLNANGVSALRNSAWCGQTEWYLGVDGDVTSNARTASCTHPMTPLTIQSRYRVEQAHLYLGSSSLNVTNTRYATVDRSDPFHCPCIDK